MEDFKKWFTARALFDIVFRHALAIDGSTLVFGTTTGNLYLSENYGDGWICISSNLARVEGVAFA